MKLAVSLGACSALLLWFAPLEAAAPRLRVDGKSLSIEFNSSLYSRVLSTLTGKEVPMGPFAPSESLRVSRMR